MEKTEEERRESLRARLDEISPEKKRLFDTLLNLDNTNKPSRIALTRSDTDLCNAGMRRQRLLLARRFDEELLEDTESDVSSTDLVSYVKTSEEEQDSQLDVMKFVEGHADPGLTLEEAKEYLHIPLDAPFPRIPGMKLSRRFLKDHHIEGIAWALKKLSSLKGCIIADSMGLGKTCQGGCAIFVLAQRQINSGETTKKPTLVVCPADLVQAWERELNELLPSDFIIYVYDSSSKADILEKDSSLFSRDDQAAKTIILSTYGVMHRRHGRTQYEFDSKKPVLYRDGIPPIKLETVVLRSAEAQDNELKDIVQKLKDQLV